MAVRRPLVALAIAVLPWAALGQNASPSELSLDRLDGRTGSFSIRSQLQLEPVRTSELTGMADSPAMAIGVSRSGRMGLDSVPFTDRCERTVPSLWRMRVDGVDGLHTLDFSYEIVGANGHPGHLSNVEQPGSEIRATIQPTVPVEVSRDGADSIIEGGVEIHLQLGSARYAGRYAGTLTVTVNHL